MAYIQFWVAEKGGITSVEVVDPVEPLREGAIASLPLTVLALIELLQFPANGVEPQIGDRAALIAPRTLQWMRGETVLS